MNEVVEFARAAAPFALLLIALLCIFIAMVAAVADNKRREYEQHLELMNFGRRPNPETSPARASAKPAIADTSGSLQFANLAAKRVLTGLVAGAACVEAIFFFAPGLAG